MWEFRRFYKLRDQLLSLGLAVFGGVVGLGVQHFVGKAAGPVRGRRDRRRSLAAAATPADIEN